MKARSAAALLLCAGAAHAQPKLIFTALNSDMGATGNRCVGLLYDSSVERYIPHTWERGVGYTPIGGAYAMNSGVRCSADASALTMNVINSANWGNLNCFAGYCFGSMTGCTPGEPLPAPSPCQPPAITNHWTAATGWVSAGSFARILDPGTGRYFGGTRCDFDINSPNDISADGRFVVGGGWYALLTASGGGPGFGLCGNYLGFVYDSATGTFQALPTSAGTSRADRVNADGTVVTGYDLDPAQSLRRSVVWRNGVMTIIDPYLGAKDHAAVNGPGTMLASGGSTQFISETFGQSGVRLVRWTLEGSSWAPENLGKPADFPDPNSGVPIAFSDLWVTGISDDGSTIIGTAQYGAPPPTVGGIRRPFIWRASINGGTPMDLEAYVASIGGTMFPFEGLTINFAGELSADGNAVLVSLFDPQTDCPATNLGLPGFGSGILYLNGGAIPCDPPRIAIGPRDWTETSGLNFGVALNVAASGSWPLSYQWQHEESPGTWVNLANSCHEFNTPVPWEYEGVLKPQLRISPDNGGAGRAGRYRVIISNSCGTAVSEPANVTFRTGACCLTDGTCIQDFFYTCQAQQGEYHGAGSSCSNYCAAGCYANCDQSTNSPILNVLDFGCFLNKFAAQDPYANCDGSTTSPTLNVLDFGCFLNKFAAGCP